MSYRKIRAYLCLVPVLGSIPSLISVLRDPDGEVKDTAKVALLLFVLWLTSFLALGGSVEPTDLSQIPGELLKGSLTSAYFLTAIFLMFRTSKGKSIALPPFKKSLKEKEK